MNLNSEDWSLRLAILTFFLIPFLLAILLAYLWWN